MANITHYWAEKMLAAALGQDSLPALSGLWLAMFTGSPGVSGSLADEVPDVGTAYARVDILSLLSTVSTNGSSALVGTVVFPTPTDTWGDITDWGLVDAATSGNVLFFGEMAETRWIDVSTPALTFYPASITVQLR